MSGQCTVKGCEKLKRRPEGNGYCEMHYTRLRVHGTTDDPRRSSTELFWEKVIKTESCWIWNAAINRGGYGHMTLRNPRRKVYAHRFSYELVHGPIEQGLVIDHRCHNKACVNPSHLRAVSQKQNVENYSQQSVKNTSGVRGVSWHKQINKWVASIHHNRRRYHIGVFEDLEEAAEAVLAKRNELFTCNDRDRQQRAS